MPQLFLNEKSCESDAGPEDANRAMTTFVQAVLAVAAIDRPGTFLIAKHPVTALQIAVGHPVGKWAGDPRHRDLWVRLRQMQSKAPYKAVYPEGETYSDVGYRHDGVAVEGLGAAHLMDGVGVSLPVSPCWHASRLTLVREQLLDEGAELTEVAIPHAATPAHVDEHTPWIRERAEAARRGDLSAVRTGSQLLAGSAAFFPHLRFLPRAEAQLRALKPIWVHPVRKRLAELEQALAGWDPVGEPEGPKWGSYTTPEHQQRKDKFCVFADLDGASRYFDTHLRFTPHEGRLHFRFLAEERRVHIAHIGEKLLD